ncbi:dienelactone hydrolase family protein [Arthrobacter sp. SDTb3-6]|uniref:dienelactone hydrolase family protein n=2 Tax=unclassified Arthrobacter TaxID=235627 RepID=UPI00159D9BC9|nr:dienelactone hydrolase family protein [Arthrobacter sp. SDTb3-6]NVN00736.1 dienelactone hydrolase family protein [Arthrobacter sp. SDTb3-6]
MGTMLQFSAAGQDFGAYRAEPAGRVRGAVVVIHEIWGLVDHIKDVADRFAAAGYLAVAPDLMGLAGLDATLLAELGADRSDPARRTEIQPRIRAAMEPMREPGRAGQIQAGVAAVFEHLEASAEGAGRTAVAGFCFGGSYSFALAVAEPRLAAAVPFYGHANYTVAELAGIRCPVLAFYGEEDKALTDDLPGLIERMREAGVDFRYTVFAGAGHAFFNDTNPVSYRAEPARIA